MTSPNRTIDVSSARRLRERRNSLGLSAAFISKQLGIGAQRYRYWETRFGPLPRDRFGERLAKILSVEPNWLLLGEGDPPSLPSPIPKQVTSVPMKVRPPQVSTDELRLLGQRAAARRLKLRIPLTTAAQLVGIGVQTLCKWEETLPLTPNDLKESRWESALLVPPGWLRTQAIEAVDPAPFIDLSVLSLRDVASEVLAVGTWLARRRERSRTLVFSELNESEKRWAIMFADRYGYSGSEKSTLQMIGNRFGLTRERVRQILEVMTQRSEGFTFELPRLSELKRAAEQATGTTVVQFEKAHLHLLGACLSLADADRFAREILGSQVAALTEELHATTSNAVLSLIGGSVATDLASVVRDASRRMIRSCGAANVMYVTGMVSAELGGAISTKDVRNLLQAVDGMEWLTKEEEWYWFGIETVRNRVLDVVRKTLSVADRRLDVEELQQAVCRSRRVVYDEDRSRPPAIEVPRHILREILIRVPWLASIQYDDFVLAHETSIDDVLNSSEVAVARTILEHDGLVTRHLLNERFVTTGQFSMPNLQIILAGSPIIQPYGYGMYGLRGVPVSESAFAAATSKLTRGGFYPDQDGCFEFVLALSEFKLQRNVIDFPSGLVKNIPSGEYLAKGDVEGTFAIGTPSAPGRALRLGALLRRAGFVPTDVVTVKIDPLRLQAWFKREAVSVT